MKLFKILLIFLTSNIFTLAKHEDDYDPDFYDEYWEDDHHHHRPIKTEPYLKCGSRSSRNNTMLVHPNFPQPFLGGSRCSYQIYRYNHKICQLKVEFLALSLAQPNGDGICVDDFFTIENGNTTVPKICGENLGQHVYVTFSNRFPISIIIATTARVTFNRRWQLRVSQIRCNSLFKAPDNCLQYHLGTSSNIQSFNYGRGESGAFNSLGVVGSRQLANLNYNICIRKRSCSITYMRPASDPFAFTLTDDVKSVDLSILGTTALQSQTCVTDYIILTNPGLVANGVRTSLPSDRFCSLGIGVINTRSFFVGVKTDENENPDLGNRGFYLIYNQVECFP